MAATVNTNAASTGESIGSPRSPPRRASSGAARTSSPTWNQIVCGAGPESEALFAHPPPPSSSESLATAVVPEFGYEVSSSGQGKTRSSTEVSEAEAQPEGSENGNGTRKNAWNKQYNAALESGLVMGAVSWPTLSESTKGSPKPPSADSLKNPIDSPISEPQVTTTIASSSLAASPSAPQKPVTSNPNNPSPNTTQHQGGPARQKSTKREAAENSSSNDSFSQHYTQSSSMGDPSYTSSSPLKTGSDSSPRDHGHNNAARDGGQRNSQQRNYRRSNSGPHMRGDGSFGGRRDQDHGNHDWNRRRSFNGRDPYAPPQRVGPSGFIRPSTSGGSAYIPPHIQPYGAPVSIQSEMQPLYYLAPHPGMPFVAQMPPAVYYPVPDPPLHAKIINQIDYYFSNENLIKDIFLRQNMDEHGWVPVQLIANFKKVMLLTTDIQLILDAVRVSTVLEIQGDKIRRRDDWNRWTMPPSVQFPTAAGSQSPHMLQDTLPAHVQGLSLDENTANYSNSTGHDVHAGILLRSSSGDTNSLLEPSKQGRGSSGC